MVANIVLHCSGFSNLSLSERAKSMRTTENFNCYEFANIYNPEMNYYIFFEKKDDLLNSVKIVKMWGDNMEYIKNKKD